MEFKQRIFLLVACFSLLNCFNLIENTYAKYSSDASASANISIAKWSILVNEQDINNNNNFTNSIVPVFTGNENIKDGVLAPNAEGYFDLVINSTNVDVSYNSNINIKVSEDSAVTDLVITGYSVNNGEVISLDTSSYVLTDVYNYSDTNKIKTYRFYVKWDDSDTAGMNNTYDTYATTSNGKAKFDVSASFIQKAN